MNKMNGTLTIKGLEVQTHLGWPEKERLKQQTVVLDIEVTLPEPPAACYTDKLEDTVCYSALVNEIHEKISPRHFFLIEYLSAELYQLIKPFFPAGTRLIIDITKHPKLPGLSGGVHFRYGDA